MAGGLGKRMNSSIPKVCHKYKNDAMINHIISKCRMINVEEIWVVMGEYRDMITSYITDKEIKEINQPIALGTGDAVKCSLSRLEKLNNDDNLLILPGDAPLISKETLETLYQQHLSHNNSCTLLTCKLENPYGYGRIIYNNKVEAIVEENDASSDEKLINIVNGGIYIFRVGELISYLPKLTNNNSKKEYYLTDVIKMLVNDGYRIDMFMTENTDEVANVNTIDELNRINLL